MKPSLLDVKRRDGERFFPGLPGVLAIQILWKPPLLFNWETG